MASSKKGSKKTVKKEEAKTTATTTTKETKTTPLPMCGDGCGLQAQRGRTFLPGHDARLASMLTKVADGKMAMEDLPALVRTRLGAGEVKLPAARTETKRVTVVCDVTVPAGASNAEAKRIVSERLAVRAVRVTTIDVGQQQEEEPEQQEEEPVQG